MQDVVIELFCFHIPMHRLLAVKREKEDPSVTAASWRRTAIRRLRVAQCHGCVLVCFAVGTAGKVCAVAFIVVGVRANKHMQMLQGERAAKLIVQKVLASN